MATVDSPCLDPADIAALVSLRRAAAESHIPRATLRRAIDRGEIPAYRYGERTIRVLPADLATWIVRSRVASRRPAPSKVDVRAESLAAAMREARERVARRRRGGRR
jgi:excisionase family DNA binding protein